MLDTSFNILLVVNFQETWLLYKIPVMLGSVSLVVRKFWLVHWLVELKRNFLLRASLSYQHKRHWNFQPECFRLNLWIIWHRNSAVRMFSIAPPSPLTYKISWRFFYISRPQDYNLSSMAKPYVTRWSFLKNLAYFAIWKDHNRGKTVSES